MATSTLLAFLNILFFSQAYGLKNSKNYQLFKVNGSNYIEKVVDDNFMRQSWDNVDARAIFDPSINQTGWAFLEIHTNPNLSALEQAFSAGFIEGYTTAELIYLSWLNTMSDFCDGNEELCQHLDLYIQENSKWVEEKFTQLGDEDDYWHQVQLFYEQVKGLAKGYQQANGDPRKDLGLKQILWLNLNGDFEDLQEVLRQRFNLTQPKKKIIGMGHCSALIKILPRSADLYVSQVTWNSYQSMIRIQKKYTIPVKLLSNSKELIPGRSMSFSSYPGVITSGDDFYLISSGLTTLETTIGNGNSSLWVFVKPIGQVFECIRSFVANRLAVDGRSWTKLFSKFNSGTYNNEWMIVDYNKFQKGVAAANQPDGLLWVLEQIPNYIYADDMTRVLRTQTYWPSYNVPAFPSIFNLSGNQESVKKFGDWFTYERNPRALIFKRDHDKVTSLKSMLKLMRYNDFKHDPLSRCNCTPPFSAENAISARNDLNPANGTYPFSALGHRSHGATDAKITSRLLFTNKLQFLSVSGPAFDESRGVPPFQWSNVDFAKTTPHFGHPDLWTFKPLIKQWA